jgi:hypothetical protein
MTLEERINNCPHGELIVPRGHIILKSIYQFASTEEVFAFLHVCEKADCSVYFRNEDISVNKMGVMSVPEIVISMYMHLKDNQKWLKTILDFF